MRLDKIREDFEEIHRKLKRGESITIYLLTMPSLAGSVAFISSVTSLSFASNDNLCSLTSDKLSQILADCSSYMGRNFATISNEDTLTASKPS